MESLFHKVAGSQPHSIENNLRHICFLNFAKCFRTPILQNTCKRLLLVILYKNKICSKCGSTGNEVIQKSVVNVTEINCSVSGIFLVV